MDYKYIEQLLERYWRCETSIAEERILRDFFQGDDIPEALAKYRSLFASLADESKISLDAAFDDKVLSKVEASTVKAQPITLSRSLRPFYKAVAVVAVILTLGGAAQHSFKNDAAPVADYNYSGYQDTYSDPEVAYEHASSALRFVSDGLRIEQSDTLASVESLNEKR